MRSIWTFWVAVVPVLLAVSVAATTDQAKSANETIEVQQRRRQLLSNRRKWLKWPTLLPRGRARSMQHDGLKRWFLEFVPPNRRKRWFRNRNRDSNNNDKVPLLVICHWATGNMRSSKGFGRLLDKNPFLALAQTENFLILSPNAISRRNGNNNSSQINTRGREQDWNDILVENMAAGTAPAVGIDDVGFIARLVEWAVQERNVDARKVYITGISSGALMAYRMLFDRPGLFTAAAVFNANLPARSPLRHVQPYVPTPIFIMLGTNDTYFPYYGGRARYAGGQVRSAQATVDYFVQINNLDNASLVETILPDVDANDGCLIVSQHYGGSSSNYTTNNNTFNWTSASSAPVQFYKLDGGGHVPAGQSRPHAERFVMNDLLGPTCHDAMGMELAWQFMSQYSIAE